MNDKSEHKRNGPPVMELHDDRPKQAPQLVTLGLMAPVQEGMKIALCIPSVSQEKIFLGDVYKIVRIRKNGNLVLAHKRSIATTVEKEQL